MSGTPVPQSRDGVVPGRRDQEGVESGARTESFNPDGYMRRSIKRRGHVAPPWLHLLTHPQDPEPFPSRPNGEAHHCLLRRQVLDGLACSAVPAAGHCPALK